MTDDQIIDFVNKIDSFLIEQKEVYNISPLDMSAIINSRLKSMNEENGTGEDYETLVDHIISQTVPTNRTLH
jgi:hypothetical protein